MFWASRIRTSGKTRNHPVARVQLNLGYVLRCEQELTNGASHVLALKSKKSHELKTRRNRQLMIIRRLMTERAFNCHTPFTEKDLLKHQPYLGSRAKGISPVGRRLKQ